MTEPKKKKETVTGPTWLDGDASVINGLKWIRGCGPIPASLMIVGEKPTRDDTRNNKPFTGDTGAILHKALTAATVDLTSTYYTNAVKYMPPSKRAVNQTDIKLCQPMLAEEIKRVQPTYILCLGANALKAVAGKEYSFSSIRGEPVQLTLPDGRTVTLFATYSPAYLNHDPTAEPEFRKDLRRLGRLQQGLDDKPDETAYVILDTVEKVRQFCTDIFSYYPRPLISLDCEWHGITWMHPDRWIRTVQLGYAIGNAVIVKMFGANKTPAMDDVEAAYKVLKSFLEDPRVSIVGHNVISDGEWLMSYGIDIRDRVVADTMLMEYLANESGPFGLEELTARYSHLGHYERDLEVWKKAHAKECLHGFGPIPDELLLPYGAKDVDAVLRALPILMEKIEPFLKPRGANGEYPSLWDITMLTQRHIYELERSGLLVDPIRLNQLINAYQTRKQELRTILVQMAAAKGVNDFNPGAPGQVSTLLFQTLGLTPVKATNGKSWSAYASNEGFDTPNDIVASSDSTTLQILEDFDPIVKYLLNYRRVETACKNQLRFNEADENPGTKGGGIPAKIWPDGRLHSHFSQLSETGRFRHSKPNCFPPGTEVLSDLGWLKFEDVKNHAGVKLAQFDTKDESISFAEPLALIEQQYDGDMVTYTTEQFVKLTCTGDHNIPLKNRKGEWVALKARELTPTLSHHKFWHAGTYGGGTVSMRESQLILATALQADGHLVPAGGMVWKLSKQRKSDRLRSALTSENITFREDPVLMGEKWGVKFYVGKHAVPHWLRDKKKWYSWVLTLEAKAFHFLANEVWFWDAAHKIKSKYSSKQRENAEWVQIMGLLSNRRTAHTRFTTKSGEYSNVNAANHAYSYIAHGKLTTAPYTGSVYCATMPVGTLVVRCDGMKPIITCNCANWPKKSEGYMPAAFGGKDKVPPNIRSCIVPPEGHLIMEGDFVQAELFVLAALSQDKTMTEALTTPGKDLHDLTAISAFKLKVVDKDGTPVPDDYFVELARRDKAAFEEFISTVSYINLKGETMNRGSFKSTIRVSAKNLNFGRKSNNIDIVA